MALSRCALANGIVIRVNVGGILHKAMSTNPYFAQELSPCGQGSYTHRHRWYPYQVLVSAYDTPHTKLSHLTNRIVVRIDIGRILDNILVSMHHMLCTTRLTLRTG